MPFAIEYVGSPLCPANNHPATNRFLAQLTNWDSTEQCYELHVPFPRSIEVSLPNLDNDEDTAEEWWVVAMEVSRFFEAQEGIGFGFVSGMMEGKVLFTQILWSRGSRG